MATELTGEDFGALLGEAIANFPSAPNPDQRLRELQKEFSKDDESDRCTQLIYYNLWYNGPVWLWLRHYYNSGVQTTPDEMLDIEVKIPGDNGDHKMLRAVVYEFILRFLDELRDIICTKRAGAIGEASNVTARGTVVAISTWIASTIGVQGPQALALATMTLWVCGSALHGAFCKMTDRQIKNALTFPEGAQFSRENSVEPDRARKGRAPRAPKPKRSEASRTKPS